MGYYIDLQTNQRRFCISQDLPTAQNFTLLVNFRFSNDPQPKKSFPLTIFHRYYRNFLISCQNKKSPELNFFHETHEGSMMIQSSVL